MDNYIKYNSESIKLFLRDVINCVLDYIKEHNIPITAIYREFDFNSIVKCDKIHTLIVLKHDDVWQSKNHILVVPCVYNENYTNKAKIEITFNDIRHLIVIDYLKRIFKFWR